VWAMTAVSANARQKSVDDMIAELARKLEELHGGVWSCKYDHELLMMRKI
jgi:hypothetical protein